MTSNMGWEIKFILMAQVIKDSLKKESDMVEEYLNGATDKFMTDSGSSEKRQVLECGQVLKAKVI